MFTETMGPVGFGGFTSQNNLTAYVPGPVIFPVPNAGNDVTESEVKEPSVKKKRDAKRLEELKRNRVLKQLSFVFSSIRIDFTDPNDPNLIRHDDESEEEYKHRMYSLWKSSLGRCKPSTLASFCQIVGITKSQVKEWESNWNAELTRSVKEKVRAVFPLVLEALSLKAVQGDIPSIKLFLELARESESNPFSEKEKEETGVPSSLSDFSPAQISALSIQNTTNGHEKPDDK